MKKNKSEVMNNNSAINETACSENQPRANIFDKINQKRQKKKEIAEAVVNSENTSFSGDENNPEDVDYETNSLDDDMIKNDTFDSNSYDDYDDYDEDETQENISEQTVLNENKGFGRYPRQYPDPSKIYINEAGELEIYFDVVKTFEKNHIGWIFRLLPDFCEWAQDFVYTKEFLHDYAVKQHLHAVKLNEMSANQQRAYDLKVLLIKGLIISTIILVILYNVFLVAIPTSKFNDALDLLSTDHYSESMQIFSELGTKYNSHIYAHFCSGFISLREGRYGEAKTTFSELSELCKEIGIEDINPYLLECDYREAIDNYNKGDFIKARDMFKEIIEYSNSFEYYQKCIYKIALDKYDKQDVYSALNDLKGISTFQDVSDTYNMILSEIYNRAMAQYQNKEYIEASKTFSSIIPYNYSDSEMMSSQCFYKNALDMYNQGQYKEARELFAKVPNYKDSQTLIKDCIYKSLNKDYDINNILDMLFLGDYRDAKTILLTSPYNFYGEWQILRYNDVVSNNETFIFGLEGTFKSEEDRLPCIAVTTSISPSYIYTWDGECFRTNDSEYKIYIEGFEILHYSSGDRYQIKIRCCYENKEVTFLCERINTLDVYYSNTVTENKEGKTDDEILSVYFENLKNIPSDEQVKPEPTSSDNSQNPDILTNTENPTSNKTVSFNGTVIEVYDNYLLLTPTEAFAGEYGSTIKVYYENSRDLAVNDLVEVKCTQDKINKDVIPYEVQSVDVKYKSQGPSDTDTFAVSVKTVSECTVVDSVPFSIVFNNLEIGSSISIKYSVNGGIQADLTSFEADANTKEVSFNFPPLPEGNYKMEFFATDLESNITQSCQAEFICRNT